eukprot:356674-Chlamydomonas_euryale.AAC.2
MTVWGGRRTGRACGAEREGREAAAKLTRVGASGCERGEAEPTSHSARVRACTCAHALFPSAQALFPSAHALFPSAHALFPSAPTPRSTPSCGRVRVTTSVLKPLLSRTTASIACSTRLGDVGPLSARLDSICRRTGTHATGCEVPNVPQTPSCWWATCGDKPHENRRTVR